MVELTLDSDLSQYSEEELKKLYEEYTDNSNVYVAYEQAVKLTLNSIYGAFGNQWFHFFNIDIAEAITKQAKRSILLTEEILNKYFLEFWHKDVKLHETLGITNVKPIKKGVSVYIDTDSIKSDSIIDTEKWGKITIEDLYNKCIGDNVSLISGHENTSCDTKVLNWTEDKKLYYAKPKRLIRHKVNKPKWKLKTKSGKEVIVTNDHSMIVFRDGKQLEVKPSEILKTDKILTVKK